MRDFDEIYRKYVKKVYGFLLRLSGNAHIADELTQETFLKAVMSIDKFRGECELSTWLCRIARNEYFNYINKKENKNLALENIEISDKKSIEDELEDKTEAQRIRKALHRLDEPYKEVFTLRTMGELSFAEIGDIFEKSEVWARVTYFRAKEKIIGIMEKQN